MKLQELNEHQLRLMRLGLAAQIQDLAKSLQDERFFHENFAKVKKVTKLYDEIFPTFLEK